MAEDDPVGTLIGFSLMGAGALFVFGAYRNKRILGQGGLLPTAISTGQLSDLSKVPNAFPSFSIAPLPDAVAQGTAKVTNDTIQFFKDLFFSKNYPEPPAQVYQAIEQITATNDQLGKQIGQELVYMRNHGQQTAASKVDLVVMTQLLAVADSVGHQVDTAVIRGYIRNNLHESI